MGDADRQSVEILRKHFICLTLICLLIPLSACATEPIWIIPGNLRDISGQEHCRMSAAPKLPAYGFALQAWVHHHPVQVHARSTSP
jgi:hypothetical protein